MQIKCEYCSGMFSDTEEKCPNCGAINKNLRRTGSGAPKTIEELKQWYIDKKLPSEDITRFFIGKDYKGSKAFGIYFDSATGNYVVYKNKSNGIRAVRYEGKDETYAVNELYQKLKSEISNQKSHQRSYNSYSSRNYRSNSVLNLYLILILGILFTSVIIPIIIVNTTAHKGYYQYNDNCYYKLKSNWYIYNDNDWQLTTAPDELKDNYKDYYVSDSYYDVNGVSDFTDTSYYDDYLESLNDDDWDSSYDWDSSDSWDSGYTDWDSDW